MDFTESKAIYLQIADYVCEQILTGVWNEGDRVLSVRELGVTLEVNPNTVLRAYDFLQKLEIIANRRGIGYFTEDNAKKKIKTFRKERFLNKELPLLFQNMKLLDISISELTTYYNEFLNIDNNEKENK